MRKLILLITTFLIFFPASIVSAALIAYWDFEETAGNVYLDKSGLANDLTIPSGVVPVPGKYGFGTNHQGGSVPYNSSFTLDTGFTIAVWVKATQIDFTIFQKGFGGIKFEYYPFDGGFHLYLPGSFSGSPTFPIKNNTLPPAGVWAHIAVTYDGTAVNYYLNGVPDGSASLSGAVTNNFSDIAIPMTKQFEVDELRIYSHALTQAEIVTIMLDDTSAGSKPIADAGEDICARAGEEITLDGSGSFDPDNDITSYGWEYYAGDGSVQYQNDYWQPLCAGSSPTCTMKPRGFAEQLVRLEVVDSMGNTGYDTLSVINSLLSLCSVNSVCGNSSIEGAEACDGNSQACITGQGYSGTQNCNGQCNGYLACTSSQSCGDGTINGAEVCDGGTQQCSSNGYAGVLNCNAQCNGYESCVLTESCGDGAVNGPEQCDDGNMASGDGCSGTCTTEAVQTTFTFEAEAYAAINSPLQTAPDAAASGGQYVYAPNGAGNYYDTPPSKQVTYTVNIAVAGEYIIWAKVNAANTADDSFWVQIDSGFNVKWETASGNGWEWDRVFHRGGVDPYKFNLTAGAHTIKFKIREDGTKIDQIILTNNLDFTP